MPKNLPKSSAPFRKKLAQLERQIAELQEECYRLRSIADMIDARPALERTVARQVGPVVRKVNELARRARLGR